MGDIIEVGLTDDDQRAIKWKKSNVTSLDGFIREFAGELTQRTGQSFGFVISQDNERIFVHPSLLAGYTAKPSKSPATGIATVNSNHEVNIIIQCGRMIANVVITYNSMLLWPVAGSW